MKIKHGNKDGMAHVVSLLDHFIRKTARSMRVPLMPKHFVVFAERFEHGAWKYWEHECDKEEIPALEDSATAKAFSRTPSSRPLYIDYLRGAEYLFNVVYGRSGPAEGDTRVFGIRADRILIAECERFTIFRVRKDCMTSEKQTEGIIVESHTFRGREG
jgi:hypothetical protein